jgi:hypothetical protein
MQPHRGFEPGSSYASRALIPTTHPLKEGVERTVRLTSLATEALKLMLEVAQKWPCTNANAMYQRPKAKFFCSWVAR